MKKLLNLFILFIVLVCSSLSLCARNQVLLESIRKLPPKGTIEDAPILRCPTLNPLDVFVDSKMLTIDLDGYEGFVSVCIMNSVTGDVVFSNDNFVSEILEVDLEEGGEYIVCLNSDTFVSFGTFFIYD